MYFTSPHLHYVFTAPRVQACSGRAPDPDSAASSRRAASPCSPADLPRLDSRVLQEPLSRQPYGPGDGLLGNFSLPLVDNGVPREGDDVAADLPGGQGNCAVLRGFPDWYRKLDLIHSFARLAGAIKFLLRVQCVPVFGEASNR